MIWNFAVPLIIWKLLTIIISLKTQLFKTDYHQVTIKQHICSRQEDGLVGQYAFDGRLKSCKIIHKKKPQNCFIFNTHNYEIGSVHDMIIDRNNPLMCEIPDISYIHVFLATAAYIVPLILFISFMSNIYNYITTFHFI